MPDHPGQYPARDESRRPGAMLFAFTGQEREEAQFSALLTAPGLRLTRSVGLHQPYLMMEAEAA